jgi:hypothetical protein
MGGRTTKGFEIKSQTAVLVKKTLGNKELGVVLRSLPAVKN